MNHNKFRIYISTFLISLLLFATNAVPASAITEGGRCNGSTGNSLVMKNGKKHGGLTGNNRNYVGPLYLCDGGKWIWWTNAAPEKKTPVSKDNPSIKPGFPCTQPGKVVSTNAYGKLQCKYYRVGKVRALMWS